MYFPLPDFELDPEEAAGAMVEGVQEGYQRYTKGAKAIVDSYNAAVGLTPKEMVWQLNKANLYRYLPVRPPEERHPVPLLLVYALINKPFIFDLVPGRSFVEYMLTEGFDVYLLDWGTPGPEDKNTTFDDYVTEYLYRAVRKMVRVSGASEISMLGYCIGATLSVIYTALYPQAPVRNMILLTAPLDFSQRVEGSMAMWLEEHRLDVDRLVNSLDNVPGELIAVWAKMLKPVENFVGIYVNLLRQLEDEAAVHSWQAINRWVEDVIPFAGEAFRQFVKDYFRANQLIRGEHVVQGQPVDLANIHAAMLNIVAQYDHLVPLEQAAGIMDLVSSEDKELRVIPSTHVGIMASSRARYKLWPELVEWLGPRSDL
ncbi:MAG: class III poly(R)-hydroxyalkanoic acid synthase subunit PhaC [Anaerolineae bacterium]|nr:class III poly(R)-hydroxyalkanoic acid synthase subunit PhaC [Anaerolineae bacterium]